MKNTIVEGDWDPHLVQILICRNVLFISSLKVHVFEIFCTSVLVVSEPGAHQVGETGTCVMQPFPCEWHLEEFETTAKIDKERRLIWHFYCFMSCQVELWVSLVDWRARCKLSKLLTCPNAQKDKRLESAHSVWRSITSALISSFSNTSAKPASHWYDLWQQASKTRRQRGFVMLENYCNNVLDPPCGWRGGTHPLPRLSGCTSSDPSATNSRRSKDQSHTAHLSHRPAGQKTKHTVDINAFLLWF